MASNIIDKRIAIDWEKAHKICPTLQSIGDKYKAHPQISQTQGPGSGGDAPGWPRHYVQSIDWLGAHYADAEIYEFYALSDPIHTVWLAVKEAQFREIWLPLPETHPIVQSWEAGQYVHLNHCYCPDGETISSQHMLIWPLDSTFIIGKVNIPPSGRRLYGSFNNPARQERWEEIRAEVERMHEDDWAEAKAAYRRKFWEEHKHLLVPENALAVLAIREFYPDHQPRMDWMKEAEAPE